MLLEALFWHLKLWYCKWKGIGKLIRNSGKKRENCLSNNEMQSAENSRSSGESGVHIVILLLQVVVVVDLCSFCGITLYGK